MSSYIIAGSADSIDTAYCEEIARRVMAKYKNIDFRIVIKHASQWQEYLQQICRIYGFLRKSNPIIYTFDGKIIGGKEQFVSTVTKYFGLDQQQLIVEDLTSKVNMKLAEEEVKQKKIIKSGSKTINEKIELKCKELLSKGLMKYSPKQKEYYLVNGIEYILLEQQGLAQPIKFIQNKEIPIINEEIQPEEINLASLKLQDEVKPEESIAKEAFVTANERAQHSEHDKLSEASKTNKMHESIVSNDKQSKGVKDSSKNKLKIDQENDDVPDFIDESMKGYGVCELADRFCVAFDPRSIIGEELIFYLNIDQTSNSIRLYNDNRPIKGHRVIIREVHYEEEPVVPQKEQILAQIPVSNQLLEVSAEAIEVTPSATPGPAEEEKKVVEEDKVVEDKKVEENKVVEEKQGEEEKKVEEEKKQGQEQKKVPENEKKFVEEQKKAGQQITIEEKKQLKPQQIKVSRQRKMTVDIQKSKTEPNLPSMQSQKMLKPEDVLSEHNSDLNLISHQNYHTLFIHKPLSQLQLKNLLYFIRETDCIGTLQFLPENPNPRVKLHVRKMLMRERGPLFELPVQQFIVKQFEDKEFKEVGLPSNSDEEQAPETFKALEINGMGFNHLIYQLGNQGEEKVQKLIKFAIDHVLSIEEQIKREIGYNLMITKKYIIVVPLVQPYEIYNGSKLYLDGLAFLGCIYAPKLAKPYEIVQPMAGENDKGSILRKMLGIVSGYHEED